MSEIHRRLGYRHRLVEAHIPDAVKPGAALKMSLTVVNEGWANPTIHGGGRLGKTAALWWKAVSRPTRPRERMTFCCSGRTRRPRFEAVRSTPSDSPTRLYGSLRPE